MFDHTSMAITVMSLLASFLIGVISWRMVEGAWKRSLAWALGVGLVQTGACYAITATSPWSRGSLTLLAVAGLIMFLGVMFADRVLPRAP